MRTRFPLFSLLTAVALLISSGCSTTSGFKMPSPSSWLRWGKKKPAETTMASASNDLPAPPSSISTPNTPPSYSSNSNPGYQATGWPSTTGQQSAVNSNGGYGAGQYPSGQAPGTIYPPLANTPQTAMNSTQGFYSPDNYRGTGVSNAGYTGQPATGPSTYGAPTYGTPASAGAQQPWNPASGAGTYQMQSSQPAATSNSSDAYGSSGATYNPQPYNPNPQPYNPQAPNTGAQPGYPAYQGTSTSGQSSSEAGSSQQPSAQPNSTRGSEFLPGSTSRQTRFGSSDSIRVGSPSAVQPAAFNGAAVGPISITDSAPQQKPATGTHSGGAYPNSFGN